MGTERAVGTALLDSGHQSDGEPVLAKVIDTRIADGNPQIRIPQRKYMNSLTARSLGVSSIAAATYLIPYSVPMFADKEQRTLGMIGLGGSLATYATASCLIGAGRVVRERSLKDMTVDDLYIYREKYLFAEAERLRGILFVSMACVEICAQAFAAHYVKDWDVLRVGAMASGAKFSAGVASLIMGIYHVRKFRKHRYLTGVHRGRAPRLVPGYSCILTTARE
jgi:hypothetical protein